MQNETSEIFFGQFTGDRVSYHSFYHSCNIYKGFISLIYTISIKVQNNA